MGAGLDPDQEAMNPALSEPPVAIFPFQLSLTAVTVFPDCDHFPFQPWVTFWSPGKSKASVQFSTGDPLLVSVTAPWKPLSHWLVVL